jgi:hypothetical protein
VLAPLLGGLRKSSTSEVTESNVKDLISTFLADSAEPVAEALAGMTDEQAEKIIFSCMGVVKRITDKGMAPIKAAGANLLMFQDINGMTLIRLTVAVVKENLSGYFFTGANSAPPSNDKTPST